MSLWFFTLKEIGKLLNPDSQVGGYLIIEVLTLQWDDDYLFKTFKKGVFLASNILRSESLFTIHLTYAHYPCTTLE